MAVNTNSTLLKRLIQQSFIDGDKAQRVILEKSRQYRTLPELLINEKLINSDTLHEVAASIGNHLTLDLEFFNPASIPEDLRNEKLTRKSDMLPLSKRGRTMYLAVVDPTNIAAIEDFEFNAGMNAEVVVVHYDKLHKLLDKLFENAYDSLGGAEGDWDLSAMGVVEEDEQADIVSVTPDKDDQPIIAFINKILLERVDLCGIKNERQMSKL